MASDTENEAEDGKIFRQLIGTKVVSFINLGMGRSLFAETADFDTEGFPPATSRINSLRTQRRFICNILR